MSYRDDLVLLRHPIRVVERVSEWEDGRALGLEVAESDWPIVFMRWVTKLEPHNGGTRITQELELDDVTYRTWSNAWPAV